MEWQIVSDKNKQIILRLEEPMQKYAKCELVAYDGIKSCIISHDYMSYILDNMNISLKKPAQYNLSPVRSLGIEYNLYTFNLWHDSISTRDDPTSRYSVFNDVNSLFLYKKSDMYEFEISYIFAKVSQEETSYDDLLRYFNNDFISFYITCDEEKLNSVRSLIKHLISLYLRNS